MKFMNLQNKNSPIIPFLKGDTNKTIKISSPDLLLKNNALKSGLRNWFTLVELIVVITILAILSTIGFVSYSSYLAGSRDSNRVSQIKAISEWLHLYSTNKTLPKPDSNIIIEANSTVIAYQWYAWSNVLETITYSTEWVDPKDKTYFSYYLTRDKKYFQLMAFLEEEDNLQSTAWAIDYTTRYPSVFWSKLWILTDNNNTPVQEIESIKTATKLELDTTNATELYVMHLNDSTKITNSGSLIAWPLQAIIEWWAKFWNPWITCPEWFIPVPWNLEFAQPWFCVAKYEMSYDETWVADVTGWTDRNTRKYNISKTPVSMANRLPITEIKQYEAIQQCQKIWAHLITNNEWMTIARNVEIQWDNWSSWLAWNG